MTYFNNKLDEFEPILQGDVFEIGSNCREIFMDDEAFAMVITADCDIANDKMGHSFTLIPIISAEMYLENYWLPELYSKSLAKIIRINVEKINNSKELKESGFSPLTDERLQNWITTSPLTELYSELKIKINKEISKDSSLLNIFTKKSTIASFFNLRLELEGAKPEKVKKELSEAIKSSRDEFLFIPDLSCSNEIGMVMKLRDVRAINKSKVFASKFDAKLSDTGKENGILRVGRFSDYLRYSIAQKFSILFSRIGMPDNFESDELESLDMLSNKIMDTHNGK